MKETLLLFAALLVILAIILKLVRGILGIYKFSPDKNRPIDPELECYTQKAVNPSSARAVLREIDSRAIKADSQTRARLFSTAGEIALTPLKRPNIAIRYYQRALRNNPKCDMAFDRLQEILLSQKRNRAFERSCWSILSRLDENDMGSQAWMKCWYGIANVYSDSKRLIYRADAIRKMLAAIEANIEMENKINEQFEDMDKE